MRASRELLAVLDNLATVGVVGTALFLWLFGRNPIVRRAMRADRHRTVGEALRRAGISRWRARRECNQAVQDLLRGRRDEGPAAELRWLDGLLQRAGRPVPVALSGLSGHLPDRRPDLDLQALSDAYRVLAHRLRSRGLLGGGSAPLLEDEAKRASATAALFAAHATYALDPQPESRALPLTVGQGSAHLQLKHLREGTGPGRGVDDVAVSHRHERLVVPGTLSERLAIADGVLPRHLNLADAERDAVTALLRHKVFDGVLPRLCGAVKQRDPTSGRSRLHLVLAEAAYSTILATHNRLVRGLAQDRELRGEAALLTLTCVPITSDRCFIITKRSIQSPRGPGAGARASTAI